MLMMNRFRSRLSILYALFAALALGVAITPACAQLRLPPGFDEAFQADFKGRDLLLMQNELNLDESQRDIVATLFNDYDEAFRAGVESVRAELGPLQPLSGAPDPEVERKREVLRERLSEVLEEAATPADQLPAGETLEQFQERIQKQLDAIKAEMEALRPRNLTEGDIQQVLDRAGARIETWNQEKRGLREKFTADLQTVLHEEQRPLWPPLERKLMRLSSLSRGRLQGESVDLFHVAEAALRLDPAAQQAAAAALEEYAIRLDEALKRREELIAASQRELIAAMQGGSPERARAIVERQVQARTTVRNVNDEFAPVIAARLPEALGPRFIQEFNARAYPRVYRATLTERLLKAAQELEGLEPQKLEAVRAMEQAYLAELGPMNEQVKQAVRQHEPAELIERGTGMRGTPEGEGDAETEEADEPDEPEQAADPIQAAFARRSELGEKYNTQLEALLTPEQYQKLPRGGARR